MKSRLLLAGFFSLIMVALGGCGYTLQGGGSILPKDVKRVYIQRPENTTSEPGITNVVSEALADEFERYGVLTVVDTAGEADAILRTKIVSVKRQTRSVTGKTDTALQQDTILTVAGDLRRVSGTLLWRNAGISVSSIRASTADTVVTTSPDFVEGSVSSKDLASLGTREVARGQEQETLQRLAGDVAQRIYDQAVTPDF